MKENHLVFNIVLCKVKEMKSTEKETERKITYL